MSAGNPYTVVELLDHSRSALIGPHVTYTVRINGRDVEVYKVAATASTGKPTRVCLNLHEHLVQTNDDGEVTIAGAAVRIEQDGVDIDAGPGEFAVTLIPDVLMTGRPPAPVGIGLGMCLRPLAPLIQDVSEALVGPLWRRIRRAVVRVQGRVSGERQR